MTELARVPSARVRVLVVDDSAVFRTILSRALNADPRIEVVGTASDPYQARDAIMALRPDVMTLDIEMPRMDGVSFLRKLMPQWPIPTIMVSTLSVEGGTKTFEALEAGAVDYVAKPAGRDISATLLELCEKVTMAAGADMSRWRHLAAMRAATASAAAARATRAAPTPCGAPSATLAPRPIPTPIRTGSITDIEAAFRAPSSPASAVPGTRTTTRPETAPRPAGPATLARLARPGAPAAPAHAPFHGAAAPLRAPAGKRPGAGLPVQLIALGASTGGVEALRDVIEAFPAAMPPVVVVQHMPAAFTPVFSGWLNQRCTVEVREARHGETLVAGTVYVAPGSAHLRVRRQGASFVALLDPESAEVSGHRPSVDALFRSVAAEAGGRAWGALLTGMGKDGAAGLLAMREAGAHTIAQDEATSLIYGMPRAAVELGAAVQTLGLQHIGAALARACAEDAR